MSTPQGSKPSARNGNRRRQRKPKVKTGCATCKIRRVKCDETRPSCLRCQKFGDGYCDGYENVTITKAAPSETRILLPKDPRGSISALIATPRQDPALQVFSNQDEFSSFRIYCEEVAPQLTFCDKSIWRQLLLQAGQDQPFIRHAIMAIGSLNRVLEREKGFFQKGDKGSNEGLLLNIGGGSVERTFAMEHYGKFLKGTGAYLSKTTKEEGRRMAMIACLLVVCIENMSYRYKAAQTHAQSGFRLLEELKASTPGIDSLNGVSSACAVEEELVDQFNRLDLQFLAIHDARTPAQHWRLKDQGALSIKSMPETFTNLETARPYLDLIMRRTYHFMGYALSRQAPVLQFVKNPAGDNHWTSPFVDTSRKQTGPPKLSDELQVEQEIYASENRRWARAFDPLFRSALNNTGYQTSHKAILLKLHSLTMMIRLAGNLSHSELTYDHYYEDFVEIVRLCKILLKGTDKNRPLVGGAFAFDMGIIIPLSTPAMHCRDRKLRREAISLLAERKLYREFQWPSETSADVARFLMEVEEEGVETEFIPEQARARLTAIHSNVEEKKGHIFCMRGTGKNAKQYDSLRDWSGAGAWDEKPLNIRYADLGTKDLKGGYHWR